MPLALVIGSAAAGFALAFIAQVVSGHPDPSYAYPLAMRIALAFAVWGMALLVSRMANLHAAATSAWLWMAVFAVLSAALMPGFSPYFLLPAIVAAVLLLATSRLRDRWSSGTGQAALLAPPVHPLRRLVPGQVIPEQEHAHGRLYCCGGISPELDARLRIAREQFAENG